MFRQSEKLYPPLPRFSDTLKSFFLRWEQCSYVCCGAKIRKMTAVMPVSFTIFYLLSIVSSIGEDAHHPDSPHGPVAPRRNHFRWVPCVPTHYVTLKCGIWQLHCLTMWHCRQYPMRLQLKAWLQFIANSPAIGCLKWCMRHSSWYFTIKTIEVHI